MSATNIDIYLSELEVSKQDIKGAIQSKGVTPTGGLSSYAEAILSIPTGVSDLSPLEKTITVNGEYEYNPIDDGVEGYSEVKVTVDIPVPSFETQSKEVTIKNNGTTSIVPDSGYDGLSSVEVNVSVPTGGSDKPKIMNGFRFTGGDVSQVDFSQYDWSAVYDISEFFRGCTSTGDWSNFEENFNGEVLTGVRMFSSKEDSASDSSGVHSIPNFGNATRLCKDMSYMFSNNRNITDITPFYQWNTSNVIDASYMFSGHNSAVAGNIYAPQITDIDLTGFGSSNGYNASNMFMYSPIRRVKGVKPTNASNMFMYSKLSEVEDIDTSKTTDMGNMFSGCTNLTSISQLDTSNVTNMVQMFYNCTNLTSISQLDTSNVTNMNNMFARCTNLTSIPQLDTSNVTNMSAMFARCTNLTSIPQLDTSKTTDMSTMFSNCSNLTSIPQLDTSNVTTMRYMFEMCTKLVELPNFNCVKVTNFGTSSTYSWLYKCRNIQKIGVVDCDSVTHMGYFFGESSRNYLTEFGGCRNLGKASSVTNTSSAYFMNYAPNLTYESVMNVINGLYDRASAGLSVLTLKLHANHLAMLSEDDIAIATNKGWIIV